MSSAKVEITEEELKWIVTEAEGYAAIFESKLKSAKSIAEKFQNANYNLDGPETAVLSNMIRVALSELKRGIPFYEAKEDQEKYEPLIETYKDLQAMLTDLQAKLVSSKETK